MGNLYNENASIIVALPYYFNLINGGGSMSGKVRTTFLSLAVIMVMVFSAINPKHAYADDDNPPAPTAEVTQEAADGGGTDPQPAEAAQDPAATEEVPATVEATSTEVAQDPAATEETAEAVDATPAAPAEDPAATETAPVVEETPAAELAQDVQPTEEEAPTSDASILSEVPENTEVAVVDANGEPQPLATQAAADAIATSDPIWCPGSQAPTPGANGCTQSFSSFSDLLTFLSGNSTIQGPGTIYVQQGAYQGDDPNNVIDFNAHDLSNIKNSDLAVIGGWDTTTNTVPTNPTPTVFDGYSIIIGSSANPWGGSLTISNIIVTQSATNGIELYSNGDVNVDNSRFDRNKHTGALIRAGKNVNVRNSVFGNGDTFTYRIQLDGLDIVSGESTSLFGVVAADNYEFGANIQSTGLVSIASSVFSRQMDQATSDTGEMMFRGYGLNVVTPDSIALLNVTANNNFLWGAKLDAGGDIAIQNSTFNANSTNQPGFIDDTGLFITGGTNVALDNVTANDNRLYGAQIDVDGVVSINNSEFNNNVGVTTINGVTNYYGTGLQVTTLSDIFLNNTDATGDSLFGGQLNAGGEVAVTGGNFNNTSTKVSSAVLGEGLQIVSVGNATLTEVMLDNNQTVGADIQSQGDAYLDTVTATDNGTDGVAVQAACVHLNSGQYSGNGQYGLNLGSSPLDTTSQPVFSGNVSGDIFPATPVSCTPAVSGGNTTPTDGNNTPTGGAEIPVDSGSGGTQVPTDGVASAAGSSSTVSLNLFADSTAFQVAGSADSIGKNISLATFLASSDTGIGIFTGNYAFLDTDDGLQIILLIPAVYDMAMSLP
jgi:hypothetical protein